MSDDIINVLLTGDGYSIRAARNVFDAQTSSFAHVTSPSGVSYFRWRTKLLLAQNHYKSSEPSPSQGPPGQAARS